MKLTNDQGQEFEAIETKISLRKGDLVIRPVPKEIRDVILGQLDDSYRAYKTVTSFLKVKPVPKTKIETLLSEQITEWTTADALKDLEDFSLVIAPPQQFKKDQVINLAKEFGEKQPYSTWVYDEFYKLLDDADLSQAVDAPVRLSLIPHQPNISGTVQEIKDSLIRYQTIPSVLEAICFWLTLREANESMNFNKTYIRHVNIEPKAVDGGPYVPISCVNVDGGAGLDVSDAASGGLAVASVGGNLQPLPSPPATPSSLPDKLTINDAVYVRES